MSGRSRWYHGSEQPDPPSSSSPVMATLYEDDDPIAPKQLFSALVSPSFQISNATLTHSRHNRRHLHPSFVSLPVTTMSSSSSSSSERENAPLDPVPAGGLVGFPSGEYWLVAWAMVDQRYGEVGQGEPRNLPPQSHVSNARTNSSWYTHHIIGWFIHIHTNIHTYIHTNIHTYFLTHTCTFIRYLQVQGVILSPQYRIVRVNVGEESS